MTVLFFVVVLEADIHPYCGALFEEYKRESDGVEPLNVRKWFFGGRTEAVKLYAESEGG